MSPLIFDYVWRKDLDAVVSYALSVHNYKMVASGDLSYTIEFLNINTTGCTV